MRDSDSEIPFLAEVRPGYDEPRIDRPVRRRRNRMKVLVAILVALIIVAAGLGAAIYIQTTSTAHAPRLAAGSAPTPPATPDTSPTPAPALKPTLTQAPAGAPAAPDANGQPPPQPKVINQKTFGDWIYSCVELPNNGGTPCGIAQQISIAKTKQTLFLWRITDDGKGGFVSTWQTPTDIFVGRGLTIEAGTPKPLVIPFQLCTTRGCQAVAGVEKSFLDAFAKTDTATAKFVVVNGREITIKVSVKGLPDALAQLQSHSAPITKN